MELAEKDISILEKEKSIIYEIDTFRYIKSPEDPIENRIRYKVKKTFIKKDKIGYLFSLEIIERTQSNKEDIFHIEDQLAVLQKKLAMYVDQHGEIISIVNRGEIAEDWYDQKKFFKKTYQDVYEDIDMLIDGVELIINDAEEFLNMVKKSEVAILLFPPIFNHNLLEKDHDKQHQVLYDFFDTTALPFKMDAKVVAFNEVTSGYQVVRSGELDISRFDEDSASQLISTIFDVHKYNIKIDASCFEAYDLNEDHTVDEATLLLNVEIPGVYSYKQISKLKAM